MVLLTANLQIWGLVVAWLVICVFCIHIEVHTVQFVSIWFAVSAAVCGILAAFNINISIQLIVFAVLSVVLIVGTRPFVNKMNKHKTINTNVDELLDEICIVTKEIPVDGKGEIKAKYDTYTAVCEGRTETICVGAKVKIKEVIGNKVVVEVI
jgi:membrane protein implicated in regulation of membrane protease activity